MLEEWNVLLSYLSSTDPWGLWVDLVWMGWEKTERLSQVGTATNTWLLRVLKGPR